MLFGNLAEICSISNKLLEAFEKVNVENEGEGIGEKIGMLVIWLWKQLEIFLTYID